MRVLFLHLFDLDLAGGSGTYLRRLVRALTASGHDVEVMAARCPDRYGCTTYPLPFDFTLTFGPERRDNERTLDEFTVLQLASMSAAVAASIEERAMRRGPADLLVVNHISLLAHTAMTLAAKYDTPSRVISYGTDTEFLERNPRYLELYRPAAGSADRVLAISRFVADHVRALLPEAQVEVLGGAVDRTVFRPAVAAAPADRIAFVGRLVTEKGIWVLLDAMRRLHRPDLVLDVVGEGPLERQLRETLRSGGMPARVNFWGYLAPAQVREVLVRAALAVVPSTWPEPLGLVVLEALACGVPVVASAVGGIPEMVQHEGNGLLVQPDDPAVLAKAIERVLRDSHLRQRLRQSSLRETPIGSYDDLSRRLVA
jgi:glycosyltransferase involved in cell wall biosynthesis